MIDFQPAVRANTSIILAFGGASGSGKTLSALLLAEGLAGEGGKILMIDSEGGRGKHYADDHSFYHYDWRPPYSPEVLGVLLREAETQGFAVSIVDSMSSEHEDEGGLCDMADAEYAKQKTESKNSAAAWAKPKASHKHHIVRWLRQARIHVIFCLRATEKVRLEKVERNGRQTTVVIPAGWACVAEKNLLYDVTTSLLFTPDRPGYPQPIKLYDKHKRFFPSDKLVSREAGAQLAEWAAGGAAAERRESDEFTELDKRAAEAANLGLENLRDFWRKLTRDERDHLLPKSKRLQDLATQADAEDNPFDGQDEHPEERQSSTPGERRSAPQSVPQNTPSEAAPRDEPHSLVVPIRIAPGGPSDWKGTKDDMLKVIADIDNPHDAAPTGAFMRDNRSNLETMRNGDKDAWSDVKRGLGNRERVLNGGEP